MARGKAREKGIRERDFLSRRDRQKANSNKRDPKDFLNKRGVFNKREPRDTLSKKLGGKGGPKGGKGMPWNPNPGPGWGYQGVCWGCGEVGHKAMECPYQLGWVGDEGSQPGTPSVGGGCPEPGVPERSMLGSTGPGLEHVPGYPG